MKPPISWKSATALTAVALLSACASSSQLDAEWTNPTLGARSGLLRGANVVVACEARDVAIRNICQDQLANAVVARGAKPVFVAHETRLTYDRALDEQLLPQARASNAAAVLVVTLTPAATDTSGSGLSFGLGGFGFGRNSAVGVGASVPVGGQRIETGFAANGRVTEVATGRLVWTASAVAPPSADLRAQIAALSTTVLDSAGKAGLF